MTTPSPARPAPTSQEWDEYTRQSDHYARQSPLEPIEPDNPDVEPVVGHYYRKAYVGIEGMCDGIDANGRFKIHFVSGHIRWYSPESFEANFVHADDCDCRDEDGAK